MTTLILVLSYLLNTRISRSKRGKRHKAPACESQRVRKWWQPFPTGKGAKRKLKWDFLKRSDSELDWAGRWSSGWCCPCQGRFPGDGTGQVWGVLALLVLCVEGHCWQCVAQGELLLLVSRKIQSVELGWGCCQPLGSPGPAPRPAFPCSHGTAFPARKLLGSIIYPYFPASCRTVRNNNKKIKYRRSATCFYKFRIFPTHSFSSPGCF